MRLPLPSARVLWPALVAVLLTAGLARAEGSADTAALQVALHERSLYLGDVDGYFGPVTSDAVQAFQRRAGLPATSPHARHKRARQDRPARPRRLGRNLVQIGRASCRERV